LSQKRRKSRGVVDTSVLVAGVAGMKHSVHESNVASAKFVERWVEERPFVWLISDDILEEYRGVQRSTRQAWRPASSHREYRQYAASQG
jgi:hypothetical protein